MKIGILTFHRAVNYGAVLQAYALNRFIQGQGIECELIDYRCEPVEAVYEPYFLFHQQGNFKSFLKESVKAPFKIIKKKHFENFLKRINVSEKQYTKANISQTNGIYDLFICGSDQIWNLTITGGDDTYFLPFVEDKKKRISYAASLGFNTFPKKDSEKYIKLIQEVGSISVREKESATLIEKECGRDSVVCVDPTLLLKSSEWEEIAEHKFNQKFVFVYAVNKPIKLLKYAKNIAKKMNCKVIYLSDYWGFDRNVQYVKSMSPESFLMHIKNAEYIVTNSFHGTVFSIIFRKKFAVELENEIKYNHRAEFLLRELELYSHVIKDEEVLIDIKDDWQLVDEKMESLRNQSVKYLLQLINRG